MRLGTRSARLLATISPLALTLALAAPATARTLIEPEIDVAQIIAAINTQTPGNSANIINSSLAVNSSAINATVTGATGSLDSVNNVADSNTSIDFENNTIFAIARGTDGLNQIGTLDTGAAGPIDGAAVFNGGFTDSVDLNASVTTSLLDTNIDGSGSANLSTSFDGNLILAEGSFNRGTSTIEVTIPGDDFDPIFSSGYVEPADNLLPSPAGLLLTAATLNVVNVQSNTNFESSSGNTALVSDDQIRLFRDVTDSDPLGGAYGVTNNAISAQANGNASDNSIFVRKEIDLDDGAGGTTTEVGSNVFEGGALVANYQYNQSGSADEGITALNSESHILGAFGSLPAGSPGGIASGENLSLDLTGNTIESQARLNSSRNEVTVDGSMQLDGQFTWDSITGFQDGIVDLDATVPGTASELTVSADLAVINRQFVEDGGVSQVVDATTTEGQIQVRLEDMDADSSITADDNAITASVSGNSAQNVLGNATPDAAAGTSPSVDSVLASVNSQYSEALDASALVEDSFIRVVVGYGEPGGDIEGFGGFENSSLSMNNNSVAASATGNAGTSSVGLSANTIDNSYDSDDGTDNVVNSGAYLDSTRVGSGVQSSDGSAGTTVVNSQRAINLLPSSIDAQLTNNAIRLFVNAHPADSDFPEGPDAGLAENDSLDGSSFDVSGNAMQAAATGNAFTSVVDHQADTTYTGSVGTLSQQTQFGASDITALASGNSIDVDLAVGDAVTDTVDAFSVGVDGNQIVARGTGNQTTTVTAVTATSFVGGAWTGFNDGSELEHTAAGAIQESVIPNELWGGQATINAALGTVVDQQLSGGSVQSNSLDNDVLVGVADEANSGAGVLDLAGAISVSNNTLGAQTRGNESDNLVLLDAAATASSAFGDGTADRPEYGPLAGIVAKQVTIGGLGTGVAATTTDNNVDVDTGGLGNGSLDVSGNRVIANAIANLGSNEVQVSALTLDVGPTAGITSSYIQENLSGEDDLFIDSSVFILNNQRNEGLDPEAGTTRGVAVTATLDGASSVDVDTDNLTSSSVSVDGNLLQATGAGNSADNRITLDIGSGPVFADILNRQGNSGDISATNDGSSVTLDIEDFNAEGSDTTSANTNMTASLDSNSIGSAAFGSSVFNGISAAAGSNFTPTNGTSSATSSPSTTVDSNGDMEAHGNMVVLNSQRTYGADGDPVQITASTTNAEIALNATGGMNQGSTSADGNRISAAATANDATNVIASSSGSGSGLPSATINNAQQTSFANVSATVTSATISTTIGGAGVGANLGGSTSVSGGSISAAATGNSAVNRISSAGQSFTRSGSF